MKTSVQKFTFTEDGPGERGFNYSSEGFIAVSWSLLVGVEAGLAFLKQALPLVVENNVYRALYFKKLIFAGSFSYQPHCEDKFGKGLKCTECSGF